MPVILHYHPLSSYCWKALIALYEKGVPFEARMVNLGDADARAAYKALWPTGKIPLLEDEGAVVPETSIMIEHVDRRYPVNIALLPAAPAAQLKARLWDRLYDAYVMTPMQRHIAQLLRPEGERDARTMEETRAEMAAAYDLIEDRMGDHDYAAGDGFTIADCAAAPSLFYAATIVPFPESHATLAAYFERLLARPSVARVIEEARPFFQHYPMREGLPKRFLTGAPDAV